MIYDATDTGRQYGYGVRGSWTNMVTGSGDLTAPFVLHVVIQDSDSGVGREVVRRALVSAWQQATDWELGTIATPLVGAGAGQLSLEEAATLLAETFPLAGPGGCPSELHIVVDGGRRQGTGRGHRAGARLIRLIHLTKQYGKFTAVDDIDLVVPSGELFGFLGPERRRQDHHPPDDRRDPPAHQRPVEIGGIDISRNPLEAKARLGFIPDRPFVYDKLTGGEFLRFAAGLYGQEGAVVERRIDELLEVFELTPLEGRAGRSYSHGMRQKLIISSALIHRPEVIVVDEPMVGLDPKSARLLKDLFRQFVDGAARC